MNNPELSPREAKTKEALESVMAEMTFLRDHPAEKELDDKIRIALAAYNPPPEPIPQIPAWHELKPEDIAAMEGASGDCPNLIETYNEIRRFTSKPA